jgi:hypothetical protein
MKLFIACAALAAMAAGAGAAPPQKEPPPVTPQRAAPPYESAFTGYRRYEERDIASWREANDEVGRLGSGHAHMKGAAEPGAAAPQASEKSGTPHPGHGMPHQGGER